MIRAEARVGGHGLALCWLLGLLLLPGRADAEACVTCPFSGLPTARPLTFGLFPGELVSHFSFGGSFAERAVQDASGVAREGGMWLEGRAALLLGFSHAFGLELEVPVLLGWTSVSRTREGSGDSEADALHSGLGDAWLSVRLARPLGAWTVLVVGGLAIPVGRLAPEVDAPASLEDRAASLSSFGTGTWDPRLRLLLTRSIGPLELLLMGQARFQWMASPTGRRPGTEALVGVGLSQSLGIFWRYGLSAQLLHHPGVGETAGETSRSPISADQTRLIGAAFLQLRMNTWRARLSAQVPVVGWEGSLPPGAITATGWRLPVSLQLSMQTSLDVGR